MYCTFKTNQPGTIMTVRENIIQISKNFRLDISHAIYDNIEYQGVNTLPVNRIYVILETKSPGESYITNHSVTPIQKLELFPEYIFFIPKDQALEYCFYPGVKIIAFHFNIEIFPGIDLFDGDTLFKKAPASRLVINQMLKLWDAKDNLGNTAILYGLIYSILGMFSDKTLKQLEKQRNNMQQFESLIQYVEERGNAQTTVGELADFCNLAQATLSKRFIRTAGVPLKTYLTRLLLRKASQQLLATDLKVREVSEELGFSSEYYFCRFFKKHTDMTPSSYRKFILQ